jgi:hypothetical protein
MPAAKPSRAKSGTAKKTAPAKAKTAPTKAIADFSLAYADQAERDFERVTKAIAAGEVEARAGL